MAVDYLFDGPANSPLTIVLAHGAGAPMDSPFMEIVAEGIAACGYRVARFEFPYMAARRETGNKRPPDRAPVLVETWQTVIADLGAADLVVGGKSMGGRIVSMIADESGVRGLVCLGYPFHPPGKPEKTRVDHLAGLTTPALFCQGERDALGSRADVADYKLSPAIRFHWLPDGDHSFKPRKASGRTEAQNLASAVNAVAGFLDDLSH